MKLVVIEGVGKKPAIQKYLGAGYKVFATMGHVRDLPVKTLAVDIAHNFKPSYAIMPDKQKVVDELKEAAGEAEQIYLATDPDREGEAISWHIANILDIPSDEKVRITFNEISKKAISKAIQEPRAIDQNLVDAQQARRVLDRLVGYKVSPVLCTKIRSKLSAGRVQSVTLRLVTEREREIQNFVPEEYWPFFSLLQNKGKAQIKASLVSKDGKKIKPSSKAEVDSIIKDIDGKPYFVSSVKKSIAYSHAPAPFKTSTMQQDAINKLGMSLKQVSQAAQSLYEGVDLPGEGNVALITYIRTDSTRVSPEAITAAREYISNLYGEKYIPAKPNIYESKGNIQDAHEAIRPISLERTPESLKGSLNTHHYKLYKLIYERFLASQMSNAEYNSLVADISCDNYGFRVSGKTPLFAGYTIVYNDKEESGEDDEMKKLPDLNEGEELKFIKYIYEQKFTKPPARYTEASLIKAMEEKGIGRPATYQPTVSLLASREYTEREGKSIKPTELGFNVVDMLIRYFPEIMDVKFTAEMETKLDTIEEGGKVWQQIVGEFYEGLEDEIKKAMGDDYKIKAPAQKTDYVCEKCGSAMVIREGRFGKFLACSAYPKCKNTKQLDENGNIKEKTDTPVIESDVICEKCGAKMVIKESARGKFLACPNYPKCKNTKELEETKLPDCPLCGKPMRKITYARGVFYGCSGYPECSFALKDKPVDKKCPKCNSILVEKYRKNEKYLKCSNKDCDYTEEIDTTNSASEVAQSDNNAETKV